MYVLAPNQTVEIFPYLISDLRRDNPGTSFPAVPSEQTLAEWNVFPVADKPAPSYDAITQNCNQLNPTLVDGEWTIEWQVTSATAEQINERIRSAADYPAFWDSLLTSTVYGAIRTQSMASLPMNTLATEFIALLGDAKAGRPNEAAIQASMSAVFATGTFTTADAEEFTAALAAGLLDDTYSLSTGP
jgi:hypothetical protein